MGLGFTGSQGGRQQYLRQKMEECWSRLRGIWDAQASTRICPESYENVNTSNLIQPPAASMVGIGIGLVGAIIVLFVANAFLYRASSRELQTRSRAACSSTRRRFLPAPRRGIRRGDRSKVGCGAAVASCGKSRSGV